jgi:hypothetical protein
MAKHKRGLHKEIRSIFDGVPIQKEQHSSEQPAAPTPEHPGPESPPKVNEQPWGQPVAPKTVSVPTVAPVVPQPSAGNAAPKQRTVAARIEPRTEPPAWQLALDRIKDKLFAGLAGMGNARQKAAAILIPVLVIALVLLLVKVMSGPKGAQVPASQGVSGQFGAVSAGEISWEIPAPYPTTLRDPTRIASVPITDPTQTGEGQLPVRGILYSEDSPAVLIGTEIIHEGEEVFGAKVVKIHKASVEFERNGKTWTQKVQLEIQSEQDK